MRGTWVVKEASSTEIPALTPPSTAQLFTVPEESRPDPDLGSPRALALNLMCLNRIDL